MSAKAAFGLGALVLVGLAVGAAAASSTSTTPEPPKPQPKPPEPEKPKPAPGGGGGGGGDPYAPPWNPPPPGRPLRNDELTPTLIAWAQELLSVNGPIHTEIHRVFSEEEGGAVIARYDWHTKQAATGKSGIFKGVTLYRMG